jgi:hypothetical protein
MVLYLQLWGESFLASRVTHAGIGLTPHLFDHQSKMSRRGYGLWLCHSNPCGRFFERILIVKLFWGALALNNPNVYIVRKPSGLF